MLNYMQASTSSLKQHNSRTSILAWCTYELGVRSRTNPRISGPLRDEKAAWGSLGEMDLSVKGSSQMVSQISSSGGLLSGSRLSSFSLEEDNMANELTGYRKS